MLCVNKKEIMRVNKMKRRENKEKSLKMRRGKREFQSKDAEVRMGWE